MAEISRSVQMSEGSSFMEDFGISWLLRSIKSHRRLLLVIPFFWLVISNVWFLAAKPNYSGELQIIPAAAAAMKSGGIGGMLSSSLGDLLGGSNGNDPMFSIYTESWTAPWFAEEILKDPAMTRQIFRDRWLEDSQAWKSPSAFGGAIRALFGAHQPRSGVPNSEMVLEYLNSHVKIQHNRTEIMTLVTMEEHDQSILRNFLNFGHKHITDHIRQIYQKRAQGSIANILDELQHVTVSEYRTALLQELADQEKVRMMAYANDQFAAQSLGLYVSDTPVSPRPIIVIILSLVFSISLYVMLLFGIEGVSRRVTRRRDF